MNTKYTVIGAGHGGKAMAAHLALMGFPTTLYNRTADHLFAISCHVSSTAPIIGGGDARMTSSELIN